MSIKSGLLGLWMILLVLVCSTSGVSAQNSQSWSIIEQCLVEPEISTTDPSVLDGTILLSGRYGIHAYNRSWETTRVLAFIEPSVRGSEILNRSLSPDKRYAVVTRGSGECRPNCQRLAYHVDKLQIYPLADTHQRAITTIEWGLGYLTEFNKSGAPLIFWSDNSHFVYGIADDPSARPPLETWRSARHLVQVDIDTGEQQIWEVSSDTILDSPLQLSPDGSVFVSTFYPAVGENPRLALFDRRTGVQVHLLETNAPLDGRQILNFPLSDRIASGRWSPDSQKLAVLTRPDENTFNLEILSRAGEYITTLSTFSADQSRHLTGINLNWSPNSQYIAALLPSISLPDTPSLQIFDLESQQRVDTCLYAFPVWSPDSSSLAFLYDSDLTVLDIIGWRRRTIVPNFGDYHPISWRVD